MEQFSVIQVNGYWLEQFLGATGWNLDYDDHRLNTLNMENENSRAFLFNHFLHPEWQTLSPKQQTMVKETLRYALNYFSGEDWRFFTDDVLPDITRIPTDFFIDIWARLFPGEHWQLVSDKGYSRRDEREPELHHNRFKYAR